MQDKTFVIAEIGVNHNQDPLLAKQLIDVAVEAGADAVKFQTFRAEAVVSAKANKAPYQIANTGEGDQLAMLKSIELDTNDHQTLFKYAEQKKIEFMSTAFDVESLAMLVELGIKRIKVPSGEITNHPFIKVMAEYDLPLILSTGMSTLAEVAEAIHVIQQTREEKGFASPLASMLTVLHCTSNYPTELKDVNLRAMMTMAKQFDLPVGYSDHTLSTDVAPAAVAMGASVIEKHITLDRQLPGPDHAASLEPDELCQMIQKIRAIELALGKPEKKPTDVELPVRDVARRSLVATETLPVGAVLQAGQFAILRPGTGIAPKHAASVIGKKLLTPVAEGDVLQWDDLETSV